METPGFGFFGEKWKRSSRERGANYPRGRQAKTELAHINQELKRLKNQIAALEDRKSKLIAGEIQ